ncbi:unnamed protein product, partial [Cuscuta europaea]
MKPLLTEKSPQQSVSAGRISAGSMEVSTVAPTSSTMAPVTSAATDAAVVITSAATPLTAPPQVTPSPASSSFIADIPGAYSLFQTLHPGIPWQPSAMPAALGLYTPPFSAGSSFAGPTFVGSPGVSSVIPPSRTPAVIPTGSLLTDLAQSISHVATNVTNIVTTKLLAVEDYTTWRTQFESFLVSQALLGMVDGSIQVPPAYSIDALNRKIHNPEFSTWLRID